jgi:hypothetical protein
VVQAFPSTPISYMRSWGYKVYSTIAQFAIILILRSVLPSDSVLLASLRVCDA